MRDRDPARRFLCSPLSYTLFPSIPAGQRRWVHVHAEWLEARTESFGESGANLRTLKVSMHAFWSSDGFPELQAVAVMVCCPCKLSLMPCTLYSSI